MISNRKRFGKNLIVHLEDGDSSCTFHDIDNLDTKSIEEAENNYEKVFIVLRELLELTVTDDEDVRLTLCQSLADALRQNNLICKD